MPLQNLQQIPNCCKNCFPKLTLSRLKTPLYIYNLMSLNSPSGREAPALIAYFHHRNQPASTFHHRARRARPLHPPSPSKHRHSPGASGLPPPARSPATPRFTFIPETFTPRSGPIRPKAPAPGPTLHKKKDGPRRHNTKKIFSSKPIEYFHPRNLFPRLPKAHTLQMKVFGTEVMTEPYVFSAPPVQLFASF